MPVAHTSIKRRLIAIIMAASTVSVGLTTLTISIIGVYNLKSNMLEELSVSASIVGDRNKAALAFDDDKLANANMQLFSVKRSIVQACLYDDNFMDTSTGMVTQKIYAYMPNLPCPSDRTPRSFRNQDSLEVMLPIADKRISGSSAPPSDIGAIYIQSDLREIDTYITKQTYIAVMVMLAVMCVSYILALRLQRGISGPVLSLAATAREISVNKDYSVRAEPFGKNGKAANNELWVLTESFNSMLQEIGERDSRLRHQNVELEKARDEAEAANRAKSQFLANISHELRTPLNAIIGFSSILMNQLFGPLGDNKYVEYSKDINESGAHLLDIINDILDLAKAEAGRLELNLEDVHVAKAIAKCLTILSEKAAKGKVSLTSNIPKNLPTLHADRLRFVQILLNVLSNAIKFTEEGGKVHIAVQEQEGVALVITVTDSGIGMHEDDIAKAFQSFGQVDSGLNRKYEGTGLGLPLTKMLVEQHNGHIELESQIGVGTKVTITLPLVTPEAV